MKSLIAAALEYGRTHKLAHGPQCSVCALPPELREALTAMREHGATYTVIAGFAREQGHAEQNASRIAHHFTERHHERKAD